MTSDTPEIEDTARTPMVEVLAPFHEAVRASGLSEEEAIEIFDQALREVRAQRKQLLKTVQ